MEQKKKYFRLIIKILLSLFIGIVIFFLLEIQQPLWVSPGCCQRCKNLIYNQCQPVISFFGFVASVISIIFFLKKKIIPFLIHFAGMLLWGCWLARKINNVDECTAIFSPGYSPSITFAYINVGLNLLFLIIICTVISFIIYTLIKTLYMGISKNFYFKS